MSDEDRFCIIGAGASGLCAAHSFARRGLAYDQFERHEDVGGMWDIRNPASAMYESAHMISTRRSTQLRDFPMPSDGPDYPSHSQVAEYFRGFARHFGLYERIAFGTSVKRVASRDGSWEVTLEPGGTRRYRGVVVANGHQFEPKLPEFPGRFDGETLHSFHYSSPRLFEGRRVLIVGAGNSGCDIALDAVHGAERVWLSMRRGYHVVPKYGPFGIPMGDLNSGSRIPRRLQLRLARFVLRLLVGNPGRFGIPEPDHELTERHAIVNSQLLYHLGHGDLTVKPDVRELAGDRVVFQDASEEQVDLIVFATGYRVSFPFLDEQELSWHDGAPRLHLHAFHPRHRDLFFVGLVESTDGGNWRLFAAQSELIVDYLTTRQRDPERVTAFDRVRAEAPDSPSGCARPYYVRNQPYLLALNEAARSLGADSLTDRPSPSVPESTTGETEASA